MDIYDIFTTYYYIFTNIIFALNGIVNDILCVNISFTFFPLIHIHIPKKTYLLFQQLDLVSPFQLYFNPILIVKQYQVNIACLETPTSSQD